MSLLVLIAYLMVDIFRPEVLFPAAGGRVLLVSGVLLFISCAVEMLVTGRAWRRCPSMPFAVGLLAAALASTIIVALRGTADEPWTKYFDMATSIFLYVVAIQMIDSRRKLAFVRGAFLLMIVALAAGGIMFMRGHDLPGYSVDGDDRLQYAGILNDANDLGLLYVTGWAIALYGAAKGRTIFGKFAYLLCLVPLGWAVFLTASRGAMLAALVAVFFTFRKSLGLAVPMVAVLAIVAVLSQAGLARMDRLSADEESAEQRLASWGQGWYMLRSNPLLGIGPRNFTEYHNKNSHSTPVQVGAEIGLVGLFCWLGFYYFPLQEYMTLQWLRKRTALVAPEVEQLQIALLGCSVASLFLSRLYISTPYLLCGMVMAARFITADEASGTKEEDDPEAESEEETVVSGVGYTPEISLAKLGLVQFAVLCLWRFAARAFISGI